MLTASLPFYSHNWGRGKKAMRIGTLSLFLLLVVSAGTCDTWNKYPTVTDTPYTQMAMNPEILGLWAVGNKATY